MKEFDVTIIGAGLAGLYLANNLAKAGVGVLLVDKKSDLSKGIHTTGIFVRKTFEDFDFPKDTLGRKISSVCLYSPSLSKFEMNSPKAEFRVGKMGRLYKSLLKECISMGTVFLSGTRYCGVDEKNSDKNPSGLPGIIVSLEKNGKRKEVRTRVIVGSDGARSRVAKDLGLDENREWIVGYEEVVKGIPLNGSPVLHCFLDNRLAPGYLAWISNDGEETHIGVGGYPSRFDPRTALKVFKQEIVPQIIDTTKLKLVETRGGRIPVGGVLKRISNEQGLLVGDAAGAVSPLTAGGLDPCLRLSRFAGEVILERLQTGDSQVLRAYSGKMFRKKFATRLLLRTVFKSARNPFFLELGFKFLSSAAGRRFAEKIFFRRSSFPDVGEVNRNAQIASPKRAF